MQAMAFEEKEEEENKKDVEWDAGHKGPFFLHIYIYTHVYPDCTT